MNISNIPPWSCFIRQERTRCNWRQRDIAELLGTTVLTVSRWERGSQQLSAYYRLKLCALFGKSAEELGLLGGDTPPPVSPAQNLSAVVLAKISLSKPHPLWSVP